MLKEIKNLWLLFLPLIIFISLTLRESPEFKGLISVDNFFEKNNKTNFFTAEEKISRVYAIKNNRLVIDSETEKNLSKLANEADYSIDNIIFEKTYPSSQGRKLLHLIACYQMYKQAEQRINKLYISLEADQIIDYRSLQYEFFGELAKDLFFDHHTFYKSADASGIRLVAPVLNDVSVPTICTSIHNVY